MVGRVCITTTSVCTPTPSRLLTFCFHPPSYDPTIEDSYSVTRIVDGEPYMLRLTDTAGQEEYRSLWAASNLQSDAFLLVYDVTNPDSLNSLEHYVELINMETDRRADDLVPIESLLSPHTQSSGSRFFCASRRHSASKSKRLVPRQTEPVAIVAGNKCDLADIRAVSHQTGSDWALTHGCGFMETSAREVINIEEAFALLARRVVERRKRLYADPASENHHPNGLASSTGYSLNSSLATTCVDSRESAANPHPHPGNGCKSRLRSSSTSTKPSFLSRLSCCLFRRRKEKPSHGLEQHTDTPRQSLNHDMVSQTSPDRPLSEKPYM